MAPKRRIDVMIEPGQLRALQSLQRVTGATISESIRRAIERYLTEQLPALDDLAKKRARRATLTQSEIRAIASGARRRRREEKEEKS